MVKWLRNTKIASAIGFLILIALVWFVGPYAGLASSELRFAWIFAIMLVWILALMIGRMLAERAGGVLEKVLRRQADDAVMGASPDKRAEITRLRQRMLAAIDTLKTSSIGKARGRAALYELPWYMIIGHPAAGKSSAILHSGLAFPFGDKQAVQGVGGTRDCDWFFSTEGVLIDTAGRYATQREDRAEWLEFLKLLKKHRSKAPVNGILVAISFPELVQHKSEQFAMYARQVRERINEIDDAFGIKVPVYLVFTKIDLLGGFAQFFEDLSDAERQQVWGATLSHDQGAQFDARRVVCQQFDQLYRGLAQIGIEKLANNSGSAKRPALFAFPIEFNAMRDAIGRFVELLFQDDPYHTKPLLRGFYFTSALQEGTPRIAAGNRVASQFDLSRPGFDATQSPASNGFFLQRLFSEVIFPDQHLITRQLGGGSNRARLAAIIAGVSILAMITAGLTWSYVGNEKLIAAASEELEVARGLYQSGELIDRLKALQVLQLRIEQLHQYGRDGHPYRLGMHLYQGKKVEHALRAEYFAGLRSVMLLPVAASLERHLAGLGPGPESRVVATVPDAPVLSPAPAAKHPRATPNRTPRRQPGEALPVIPIGYNGFLPEGGIALRTASFTMHGARSFQPDPAAHPFSTIPVVANVGMTNPEDSGKTRDVQEQAISNSGDPSSSSSLDDGYNALKTYLMLKQKDRMDMSHLSDQIPRYWRSWLDANKGRASMHELNRLAERLVAFYVSQIDEPDLPLIDTREDLISASREILRGALHRMSASERVYNELKARANTQFSPITVGKILDNENLSVIAGSHAVPGAFTREAWDKYFKNSLDDASKGEIKGDDWVLAARTIDDLGKEGNVERNRAELEALYKADYIREWKKFLQGVAIRDFATLENAAQAMGQLSDPQHSSIRRILEKVAFETAWDNPSQLSTSLRSAKNSVIERTEKLVLGTSDIQGISATTTQLGMVGSRFSNVGVLAGGTEGGRAPLSAYLEALGKLKAKLAQLASNGEPDSAARQFMQATLTGSGSELVEALAIVDGVLLANVPDETKEIIRPLLVRPLIQTYSALIPFAERDINRAWQTEVLASWRSLAGKYPFADSGNEASMGDIAKFLKPGEGTLPKFVDKNLAGLVSRRGDTLVPRSWANLGLSFNPAFLNNVARLSAVGTAVLQEGDGARFEMQPIPTPGIREILFEVDGQVLHYRNGPQPWTAFSWPNPASPNVQASRIQTVSFSGVSTSVANFTGRLSLMRLLSQARADNPASPTVQLEWRLGKTRASPEQAAASEAVTGNEADVVRFNFRMVSGANPLSLSGLRRVALPEKITN